MSSKALNSIKNYAEIEFLKSCSYEDINKMMNQLNDIIVELKEENAALSVLSREIGEKKLIKSELELCKEFLLKNGWSANSENGDSYEFDSYHRAGSIDVDISDKEIVLLCDSGDFLHLGLNYFALVGSLVEYKQIGFNYISTRKDTPSITQQS